MTLLFLFCLFSCKNKEQEQSQSDEPCRNHPTYTDIDIYHGMDGFFFKTGSYWIYKNDSLNTYDSVLIKILQGGCESVSFPAHMLYPGGNWNYYKMNYSSYPSGDQYYDIIERDQLMRNFHPSENLYTPVGWTLFFDIPDTNYIDSMKVAGHTFYLLYKSSSLNSVYNPPNITAYTAKKHRNCKENHQN